MQESSEPPSRKRVRELINAGAYDEACRMQGRVCDAAHAGADDFLLLARLQLRLNALAETLAALDRVDALDPDHPESANARAHALSLQGRAQEAHRVLERQRAATPNDVETVVNLGYVAEQLTRHDEALGHYTSALERSPHSFRPRLNRAGLLSRLARHAEAMEDYDALVEACPDRAAGWYNRAECLSRLARHEAAAASCERALELEPGHVYAMMCRAVALAALGDTGTAQMLFEDAWNRDREVASRYGNARDPLTRAPDARAVYVYQAFSRLYTADWREYEAFVAAFEGYANDEPGPPDDLSMAFPAMYALPAAQSCAAVHAAISEAIARGAPPVQTPGAGPRERLRIGYVSSKFRPGASMAITGALYAAHDRSRFEVFAYALNPDDGNPERSAVAADCDRFVDLSRLDDTAAAERIRSDGVDILVDLNGYSNEARPAIVARRPAPVQVAYPGHMHSLHARWIDYRITDRIAEPDAHALPLPEARAFLPASFLPYDQRNRATGPPTARADLGLPEEAFVFCAFTTIAKMDPGVFAAWMKILHQVDRSLLWLLDPGEAGRENLVATAARAGVAPERLVFAPRVPRGAHMRRLGAADLFLDTFVHGAHGAALDVLHAGLPMLTRRGDALARRVGASLLTAVELPDLIASGTDEYIGKSVSLAADSRALARLRAKLERRIETANPFATERVAARLEQAFETMWARRVDGLSPEDFDVT